VTEQLSGHDAAMAQWQADFGDDDRTSAELMSGLLPEHAEWLAAAAISAEFALQHGVRSVRSAADLGDAPGRWAQLGTGVLFTWSDRERIEYQFHPDNPRDGDDGRPRKYEFRSRGEGYQSTISVVRPPEPGQGVLLVEGSKQHIAAAEHAPFGWGVLGIPGCWGTSDDGVPMDSLSIVDGRDVVVCLDADMDHNAHVWDSGERTQRQLLAAGAASVRWIRLPASGTAGLDDVLAEQRSDRVTYIGRLIEQAEVENFPKSRRPKGKPKPGDLFDPLTGALLAENTAKALIARTPMMRTNEGSLAVYSGGVYRTGATIDAAFRSEVARLLANQHRASHVPTLKDSVSALVTQREPEHLDLPILNCANGIAHLETGEFIGHTPLLLSRWQTPVAWVPDASCPAYDNWIASVLTADQIDGLEEAAAAMLDPRATPSRALVLFGPSRSGKSTFIRLLEAVAGQEFVSSVGLQELAEDQFSAANVNGAILNAVAELSATDVSDLRKFKMMTGDDSITANRKYGMQFTFRNRALFAFSCNDLPTVSGESSRAFINRTWPVHFDRSFEGHEDPEIERAMLRELPGILQRWTRAWRARQARGAELTVPDQIAARFRQDTNSAARFIAQCCDVLPVVAEAATPTVPDSATTMELHGGYKVRMERDGQKPLGRTKFAANLRSMAPDVRECVDEQKRRTWSVRLRHPSTWAD
jgi:putative DNA primase/helicase